ncbi:Cep164 [Symbiodinium pilosum]|uniref:Cep164 protein n=1 Tax=Symbiodinium pilosum TaxID=2952 RepID=A0A812VVN1_SYMPI|nr:Cep164 [Symbiodinium pilosum]
MAAAKPTINAHIPKTDIVTRHKVIRFGTTRKAPTEQEAKLYAYLHQRADLKVSRGSIPVGFYSCMFLDEGQPLYLETRYGGNDDEGEPVGPQYQVSWKAEKEVIPPLDSLSDGWYKDLDDLWSNVLSYFEKRGILSEETLEYLDADPFVLFGVDDALTQQALLKLEKFPALMCDGSVPTQDEWAYYLRIEPRDPQLMWLVRAMQETELPKPWTCYKGIGSIVCYLRSDSGQVTWKHPFYDYFRQLRDFCRQASRDEVMQVRCNRLLWSYEATRVETEHDQEPLISPPYVARMADIFGFDVKVQGCVVRNCKAQLKAFAKAYRTKQDIEVSLIRECNEMLQRDVAKYSEMVAHWSGEVKEDVKFDLNKLAAGELHCVNCKTTALSFCLECKDYLCLKCYADLHGKGSRKEHAPFCLVPCALCVVLPAKIHCTFTDKSLCHKCYAMKHIKMLPLDGKENQPRRINYVEQYNRYAEFAKERVQKMAVKPEDLPALDDSAYESVLSTDWHPFYDARGVRYYHNFATGERMRQSPRRVPNTDDAGAEETTPTAQEVSQALAISQQDASDMALTQDPASSSKGFAATATSLKSTGPLPLTGFDSLKSDVPAAVRAAEDPEHRTLRPPHRRHMPDEIT